MKLSTRSRYGVRALVDLALCGPDPISLRKIAGRQCLTPKYLERLFAMLRKFGVVHGRRGAAGGYSLAKPPSEIRVGDMVRILEGSILIDCVHGAKCNRKADCMTYGIWRELDAAMMDKLNSYTISDLASGGGRGRAGAR